jgi:hypothetical protein
MRPDVVELRKDQGFVEDFARFAEGILSEKQVRAKYHLFDESTWVALDDDAFVEAVELEKTRRIRSGAAKRELAQLRVVAAPNVLSGVLLDPKTNPRHKIDAARALDDLAGFAPDRPAEQEMVQITINLGGGEVCHYGGAVNPTLGNDGWREGKIIDAAPKQIAAEQPAALEEEVVPLKRGRGRPKGSRNRPKVSEDKPSSKGVPGFDV